MLISGAQNTVPKQWKDGVSIIIVTYNAANTLQQCLDSIYAQRYTEISITLVDGGSTDGTLDILEKNKNRFHYCISEPDKGVYDAMNKALQHIDRRFVYFLGADDELLPAFSDFAKELQDDTAIYYANVLADNKIRLGKLSEYQMAKAGPYHQAMAYPKKVFENYQYDLKYRISADNALTLTLYGDKRFHFVYLDHVICLFNHTGISGNGADDVFEKDKSGLILKNFGWRMWLRFMFREAKRRFKK